MGFPGGTLDTARITGGTRMEFMEVIKTRHSVRAYENREVDEEKFERILECARLAPSARNSQCWNFIVVKDKGTIERLSEACGLLNPWLKKAPAVIIGCANPDTSVSRNGMDYYLVDLAIAMEHLVLAATDQGLGTCWIAGFSEEKVKEALEIPKEVKVVAMTPIGYPAQKKSIGSSLVKMLARTSKRKPMQEIVHREKW